MNRGMAHESHDAAEDVASLYSWANLHGAKYRDYSASRAANREKRRQRLEQEERLRATAEAAPTVAEQAVEAVVSAPFYSDVISVPAAPAVVEWAGQEDSSASESPAWLAASTPIESASFAPQSIVEPLQASRDRLASRWFALKNIFEEAAPATAIEAEVATARAPVVALFSLAGGVGKTSLVATLGRALSARGERVLLVDTAEFGVLPFFFGAREPRPGVLRTFSPPVECADAPIQLLSVEPESLEVRQGEAENFTHAMLRHGKDASRMLVDVTTASAAATRRLLRLAPTVLVPIVADMSSVVSVRSIEAFFRKHGAAAASDVRPYYVLNQFDAALPLHLDVREVLREQLGDRLLPFVVRRSPLVGEALAEGMTVMDYAANSAVAEDFHQLAGWVRSHSAPVDAGARGMRWSER